MEGRSKDANHINRIYGCRKTTVRRILANRVVYHLWTWTSLRPVGQTIAKIFDGGGESGLDYWVQILTELLEAEENHSSDFKQSAVLWKRLSASTASQQDRFSTYKIALKPRACVNRGGGNNTALGQCQ